MYLKGVNIQNIQSTDRTQEQKKQIICFKKSADDLPMDEDSFEDEWIETVSDDEVGSV